MDGRDLGEKGDMGEEQGWGGRGECGSGCLRHIHGVMM